MSSQNFSRRIATAVQFWRRRSPWRECGSRKRASAPSASLARPQHNRWCVLGVLGACRADWPPLRPRCLALRRSDGGCGEELGLPHAPGGRESVCHAVAVADGAGEARCRVASGRGQARAVPALVTLLFIVTFGHVRLAKVPLRVNTAVGSTGIAVHNVLRVLALITLEPFVCWSSPNRTRFTAEHLLVPCEAFMSRIDCTVVGFLQQVAVRNGDESTVAREGLCEFTNAWAGPSCH